MRRFRHICSLESLFSILVTREFSPVYKSPLAGDSGINGYLEGDAFNRGQEIAGEGAELIIEWGGKIQNDLKAQMEYPLPPNVLVRQGAWRSVIPCRTDSTLIKVVDFEIHCKPTYFQKLRILKLKKQLKKEAAYLKLV